MRQPAIVSMGPGRYDAPSSDTLDARQRAADQPGRHLWVLAAAWLVTDPTVYDRPGHFSYLDAENLIIIEGPGCFKCNVPYSPQAATARCPGE